MAAKTLPHLPDIPNAGYSTRRQRLLSDNMMEFMRQTERDRFRLLTIVIEGIEKWRRVSENIWRGLSVTTDLADAMFRYFELQAAPPNFQVQLLDARQNPPKWRDIMREAMPVIEEQREAVRLMDKWGVH